MKTVVKKRAINGETLRCVQQWDGSQWDGGSMSIQLILHQSEWDKLLAGVLADGRIITSVTCDTGDVWHVSRFTDAAGTQMVSLAPPPLSSGPFSIRLAVFNCLREGS